MKHQISLILFFACNAVFSQNFETIADGDWNNPLIWNLATVPGLDVDEVAVHHHMVGDEIGVSATNFILDNGASIDAEMELDIYALDHMINGDLESPTIIFGASLTAVNSGQLVLNGRVSANGDVAFTNLSCTINGEIDAFRHTVFVNSALVNHGSIETDVFSATIVENSGLLTTGSLATTTDVTNNSGAVFSCIGQMIIDGEIINDGDISSVNMTLGSINATGNGGRFCISDCLLSSADFEGNLDVCDATPHGACDLYFNFSFGDGVTLCTADPCDSQVGVEEIPVFEVNFYPNPAQEFIMLYSPSFTSEKIQLQLFNAAGQLVQQEEVTNFSLQSGFRLDLMNIPDGLYQILLIENGVKTHGRVVVQRK